MTSERQCRTEVDCSVVRLRRRERVGFVDELEAERHARLTCGTTSHRRIVLQRLILDLVVGLIAENDSNMIVERTLMSHHRSAREEHHEIALSSNVVCGLTRAVLLFVSDNRWSNIRNTAHSRMESV